MYIGVGVAVRTVEVEEMVGVRGGGGGGGRGRGRGRGAVQRAPARGARRVLLHPLAQARAATDNPSLYSTIRVYD